MNLIYTPSFGHSTNHTAGLPGKYGSWPDAKNKATPPPQPPPPVLSLAYPLLPKASGPASVA